MATMLPQGKQQYFADNGDPLSGGRLYTYAAGTSTPLPTFADSAGTIPNTNPVILDARGEATIYWGAGVYDVALRAADDSLIWTAEDISDAGERLRADLASDADGKNDALVTMLQPYTDAVPRTLHDKVIELISVEDFGAVGDGVTNDSAAVLAMHNAVGFARFRRKTYYLGESGLSITATSVCLLGDCKAALNASYTQAIDGTGTILLGSLTLRADYMRLWDFTQDVSRFATEKEGIVADARVGQNGRICDIQRISTVARDDALASHGLLIEGFNRHTVVDVDVANHNYGVVTKSRRGKIDRIRGANVTTAVVYAKSDIPSLGGNVASALADNIDIGSVEGFGGDPDFACAVWIHASTLAISRINVRDATHQDGLCAVRVLGSASDPGLYVIGCRIEGLTGANTKTAPLLVAGYTFEMSYADVQADNPLSALAVSIDAQSTNYRLDGITLLISTGSIVGTTAMICYGAGMWDNITVRNQFNTMTIVQDATVIRGRRRGNVLNAGEGTITLVNGAVAALGEVAPQIRIRTDNLIMLDGVVDVSAVSGTPIIGTIATLSFGAGKFYSCTARKDDNSYTTFNVYVGGTEIRLFEDPVNIKFIWLNNIVLRS